MNLFLVANRRHRARILQVSAARAGALLAVAVLLLVGLGGAAGLTFTAGYRALADQRVSALRLLLEEQAAELQDLEQSLEATLETVAGQMGAMSARLTRLDALGGRLTRLAELDDGEFDFSAPPAMGGPMTPLEEVGPPVDGREVTGELVALQTKIRDRRRQLAALESMLRVREVQARVEPNGPPIEDGWISSPYGRRTDPFTSTPAFHSGIDFAGRAGTEVKAVADGVVTFSGRRYGYGNLVEITHGNGLVTRYAHNQRNLVEVGDRAIKGGVIALMGATGRATGPNLHFEVLRDGRSVNPMSYVRGSGSP